MAGGDGASLEDETGKQVWRMLQDPEIIGRLTTDELKQIVDIMEQAWRRKNGL